MASKNLSFRTPQELLDKIKARDLKGVDNPGAVAKREVERWYSVLQESLSEVRLTPAEAVVLIHHVEVFDGQADLPIIRVASDCIADGSTGLSSFYGPVRASLARQMARWSFAGLFAAWDAAERYHVLVKRNFDREEQAEDLTFGMALHRVGLHTYDLPPEELEVIESTPAVMPDRLPDAYLRALEEAS
jgi:hypothetical protein